VKRYDLVIINRSFWPVYPVIGEGLLKVAEKLAGSKKISVVLQDHDNIKQNLKKFNRGAGVDFFSIAAFSNSSSSLIKRTLDSIFFMFGVIFCLVKTRPKIVYISTDPPILIPFVIALFSAIMNFKYIYHLQDIHPEASSVVIKLNKYLLRILKKIDNFSIRRATILITLNEVMKVEILKRLNTQKEITIIENPSIIFNIEPNNNKKKGFVFSGNLGRLQRIPLLIDSIQEYRQSGGALEFAFVGGGIFSKEILNLSKNIPLIKYHGKVTAGEAGVISSKYEWALAPIEDLVTRYSFPSKLSSYIHSEAKILAICGEETSVAHWVRNHKVGIVVKPVKDEVVKIFFAIENNYKNAVFFDTNNRKELKKSLSMDNFVKNIISKILLLNNE
jgi:glycosyltransferase involved in cell wall biosynthesis